MELIGDVSRSVLHAVVVVPYFGRLPSYFPLWLASLDFNPSLHFLLITDQDVIERVNLTVDRTDWTSFRTRISDFFDFEVNLTNPYKICDFRPASGETFADEIGSARYWGSCDVNLVFGTVSPFLPDLSVSNEDKILVRGNFSLYRNVERVNSLYRKGVGALDFSLIASNPLPLQFDEWRGIYPLMIFAGIQPWNVDVIFDIDVTQYGLRATTSPGGVFGYVWSEGRVYEYDRHGLRGEGALIHLQKRHLEYSGCTSTHYVFEPDRIRSVRSLTSLPLPADKPVHYQWASVSYRYLRFKVRVRNAYGIGYRVLRTRRERQDNGLP